MKNFKFLNEKKIEEHYGQDMDIFLEYAKKFLASYEASLTKLEDAIKIQDFINARRIAHDFVGFASSFFAEKTKTAGLNLEERIQLEIVDEKTIELFLTFRSSLAHLIEEINALSSK